MNSDSVHLTSAVPSEGVKTALPEAPVTGWFSAPMKPARLGMYQRKWHNGDVRYSFWNGAHWTLTLSKIESAVGAQDRPSSYQSLPWRGLASKSGKS